MCYPPIEQIGPGMTLPENYLERTGYRLPTEAEWEYACRSGSTTVRFFGSPLELLPKYAWYVKNSNEHVWPVGTLMPNDFGLFDVYGNVVEWCQDTFGWTTTSRREKSDLDRIVDVGHERVQRGGAYYADWHRASDRRTGRGRRPIFQFANRIQNRENDPLEGDDGEFELINDSSKTIARTREPSSTAAAGSLKWDRSG